MAVALTLLRPYLTSLHPIAILGIMSVVGLVAYAPVILALDQALWRTVRAAIPTRARGPEPVS